MLHVGVYSTCGRCRLNRRRGGDGRCVAPPLRAGPRRAEWAFRSSAVGTDRSAQQTRGPPRCPGPTHPSDLCSASLYLPPLRSGPPFRPQCSRVNLYLSALALAPVGRLRLRTAELLPSRLSATPLAVLLSLREAVRSLLLDSTQRMPWFPIRTDQGPPVPAQVHTYPAYVQRNCC